MQKKLLHDLQGIVAGAATSTILYGCNLILAASCIQIFHKLRKREDSRRRQVTLLIYILGMMALATQAVVHTNQALIGVTQLIAYKPNVSQLAFLTYLFPPHLFTLLIPIILPITIWGADGILIWRCVVLYQGVERRKRIALHVLLGMISMFSLASGAYSFWTPSDTRGGGGCDIALKSASQFMLPATFATNTVVSGLIAARLLYAQRILTTTMPNYIQDQESESPYMSALAICVESSALIALVALISLITTNIAYGRGTNASSYPAGLLFPIIILPQICVMSPLLIVYRVARGRASDVVTRFEDKLTQRSIAFRRSVVEGSMIDTETQTNV